MQDFEAFADLVRPTRCPQFLRRDLCPAEKQGCGSEDSTLKERLGGVAEAETLCVGGTGPPWLPHYALAMTSHVNLPS